jgi:lipooligosaccharide transport system permease protein
VAGIRAVVEHRGLQYRRTLRASLFGSFVNPVMFLAAMGLGLGGYVDRSGGAGLAGGSYLQFLGPGLLAATVMQSAAFESTYPIIGGFTWNRIFLAMAASPLSPREVALGTLAWITIRMTTIALIFTVVLALFGAASSPLVVLAIPVAVLTGLAFAGFIGGYAARLRTPDNFNVIFRFGIMPLFLLSGTFFPLTGLPAAVQALAWLSPLWHGVSLARALALGTVFADPVAAFAHVAILLLTAAVGGWWMIRMVERRLAS